MREALVAEVMGELEDLIGSLDRHGAAYARTLVDAIVTGRERTPAKPQDIHPDLARAVREIVMEQAQFSLGALPVRFR